MNANDKKCELLAPAGDPECGYAALHFGADALYLGLPQFSARAEAVNFSLDDLSQIVAYAHSLQPGRRVFVTVNTLLLQVELPQAISLLVSLADAGVDAVIVQDLGVARLIRRHVPELRMHASTQMAIHNLAGAQSLKDIGFSRVTLARELTVSEVRDITANCGIETESFIHGALCYSYSGLCLFSSMLRGRSGNRGRCTYPCRDLCRPEAAIEPGFAFSMKDLAAGTLARELRDAGVSSLKIEGRKKSALYVSTVTNYYRRILDGKLEQKTIGELEAQMKTVFSRPWTKLYIDNSGRKDVVDRDMVGHRGVPIGKVETIHRPAGSNDTLRFTTSRAIERHDGLQIDISGEQKPFGFPVDELTVLERGRGRTTFEAPAGSIVDVVLPEEHPLIPVGATVYCSSSQAVKRGYPYDRPKPNLFRARRPIDVVVQVRGDALVAHVVLKARHVKEKDIAFDVEVAGTFAPAKDPAKSAAAARQAFEKLGDTQFQIGEFKCDNPQSLFAPVSLLNDLRRKAAADAEVLHNSSFEARVDMIVRSLAEKSPCDADAKERWMLKVDRVGYLSSMAESDWAGIDEIIVDVSRDPVPEIEAGINKLAGVAGREKIRLALPEVTRSVEESDLRQRLDHFKTLGWTRWQILNLSAWRFLKIGMAANGAGGAGFDVSADWPLYAMNSEACNALMEMGASGFTISPEDTRDNMASLLDRFGSKAQVILYQDTPLFMSASCAFANLSGECAGRKGCAAENLLMRLSGGETVISIQDNHRTIVINEYPFCLSDRLPELRKIGAKTFRCDFIWQTYSADEVRELWQRLRSGVNPPPRGYTANFNRGLR